MIALVDYGMGNHSRLCQALGRMGHPYEVIADPAKLTEADGIILSGVGAFPDAMYELEARGFARTIKHEAQMGKPLLGIGLGMQLLFTSSDEHGYYQGLHLLPGHVVKLQGNQRIPHIGWNWLAMKHPHPLFQEMDEDYVYFMHTYHVQPANPEDVIATTDDSQPIAAIVARNQLVGMQFHPERSGPFGLKLLDRMIRQLLGKAG